MTGDTDRPVAIVTAASRGLAIALALGLGKETYDLLLGADPAEELRTGACQASRPGLDSYSPQAWRRTAPFGFDDRR